MTDLVISINLDNADFEEEGALEYVLKQVDRTVKQDLESYDGLVDRNGNVVGYWELCQESIMTLKELEQRCKELRTIHNDDAEVYVMDLNGVWLKTVDIEGENTREITISTEAV